MNDFRITIKNECSNYYKCRSNDVCYEFSRQYERDSFFYEEDGSFLLFVGICFNKDAFLSDNVNEWPTEAFRRYRNNSNRFLEEINGYYAGMFYNSMVGDVQLFVDHLSTIPVFYFRTEQAFVVDTDLFRLISVLKELNMSVKLSEFGAYSMLAYSFMLDNYTPIEGVYKVRPASCYSCLNNHEEKYYEFYAKTKDSLTSVEEIIEGVDQLFNTAVSNLFSADVTLKHLVTLSGGLDSRMCLLYALNNGYKDITTINYSQSFYNEELIPKKIAADYGCSHIFFSLDNGNYLMDIDEGICATYGMTTYRPILSARTVWKQLKMDEFGFVHSGLLGDTILGGYCIDKCNNDNRFHSSIDFAIQLNAKNKTILSAPYKEKFIPFFFRIQDWMSIEKMESLDSEKYVIDNRYLNGLIQSALGTRGISVLASPYTDKMLMKYVYTFPSSIKKNHNLYFKWMKTYMREATNYKWENTLLKPVYGKVDFKPHDKTVGFIKGVDAFLHPLKPERSRNPYKYWMKHNDTIQKTLSEYCKKRLELLSGHNELLEISKCILEYDNIYLLIRLATLLGFAYKCEE